MLGARAVLRSGDSGPVAVAPPSISATATSSSVFWIPRRLVVAFGIGACGVLVAGRHVARLPFVASHARLSRLAGRAAKHAGGKLSEAIVAWAFLVGCWTTRASGSTLLLAALGIGFSPKLALVVLCLSAAASLIPIASGGAIANVGATAAILLTLGVQREAAINFSLASGFLLCRTAA